MALRAILDKGENDVIAQLPASPLAAFAQRSWASQVIARRLRWLLWAFWGLNRAGVAPAAVAGTKGSPTGANGGPFLPTRLSDVAEPFCVRPADQSTKRRPGLWNASPPRVIITQIIEGAAGFALLLKSKKAKRMISNLFALSVRFLS